MNGTANSQKLGRPHSFANDPCLPPGWEAQLSTEFQQDYYKKLARFLALERSADVPIFPKEEWTLRALQDLDYEQVRVVILGQDPYHGDNQAIGLSFAVPNETFPKPPSLVNIFKELKTDLGVDVSSGHSDLRGWVKQGVLLLNTVLTVRKSQAFSHRDQGWEILTDRIIAALNERLRPVIFILWGAASQKKKSLISNTRHFIIESAHPSPLSAYRGFWGSKPFSQVNKILSQKLSQAQINWASVGQVFYPNE